MRGVVILALSRLNRATPAPAGHWLYLGSSAETFYAARRALDGGPSFSSGGELVNAAMHDVRAELIDFDDVLEYRSDLLWQSSDLAERNPYVSSFLYNAAALVGFSRLLENTDDDLTVVVDDGALGRELAKLARANGADVQLLLDTRHRLPPALKRALRTARVVAGRIAIVREHLRRRKRLRRTSTDVRDVDVVIVTWAEDASFASGHDKYFGKLAQDLRDRGDRVALVGLALPGASDDLLRAAAATDDALLAEECVGVRALLRACAQSLRPPARAARPLVVAGVDLTTTLEEALERETASRRWCWSLGLAEVGPALAKRGVKPRVVVHPFENQGWEEALRIGIRRALPGTQLVGYQHTPNSFPGWFSRSPSHRDLREGQLPDRIALLGPAWESVFAAAGYPADRLEVAPALRYADAPQTSRAHNGANVLAACTASFDDALELTVKAIAALGDEDLQLVVKTHPDLRSEEERFRAAIGPLPSNVSFSGAPISELLASSDVLLHTFTSVAWEALAFDVPTVFVTSEFWLDVDPLLGESPTSARTPAEIAAAVRDALATTPERVQQGKELLAGAFSPNGEWTSL